MLLAPQRHSPRLAFPLLNSAGQALCSDLDLLDVVSARTFWGRTLRRFMLSRCQFVPLLVMVVSCEQNGVWRFLLTPSKVVSTLVNK